MNHFTDINKKRYFNPPNIEIIGGDYVRLDKNWNGKDSHSPFSLLYIVENGCGEIVVNGNAVTMKKNHAYLIPAGSAVSYHCNGTLTKLFLHFNMLEENGFDYMERLNDIYYCEINSDDIAEAVKLFYGSDISDALKFRQIVYRLLGEILSKVSPEYFVCKEYSPLIKRAVRYIRSNLSPILCNKDIAEHLLIGESTLRKHFKEEMGVGVGEYIESLIMFRAEILLRTTTESILDISIQLGYKDQFYFSRRFSKKYGISPQRYRKKHI